MCLSGLHFHPCFVSEPNCNCCLSNKYTYMQLRSPELTRVNFHLSPSATIIDGMSLVQQMKGDDKTFAQLAESALAKASIKEPRANKLMLSLMSTRRRGKSQQRYRPR